MSEAGGAADEGRATTGGYPADGRHGSAPDAHAVWEWGPSECAGTQMPAAVRAGLAQRPPRAAPPIAAAAAAAAPAIAAAAAATATAAGVKAMCVAATAATGAAATGGTATGAAATGGAKGDGDGAGAPQPAPNMAIRPRAAAST